MILEKETYEKFGYYSSDLSPQSHKKILTACDDCGKIREVKKCHYRTLCISCGCKKRHHIGFWGKNHSEESKRIMRKKHKGQKSAMLGKYHSDAAKRKNREAHLGKHPSKETREKMSEAQLGRRHSEETKAKMRERRKHRKYPHHHTKPELIFEEICKKNNLPFKYTGDGSFWIKNINPDFIERNDKKIAIEIFGDYWHSPLLNRKLKERSTLAYRKKILKKYGWKLIVLWETDLLRKDAEQFVLSTLKKYL